MKEVKFSQLPYTPNDFEALQREIDEMTEEAKKAVSFEELKKVIVKAQEQNSTAGYNGSLAYIRNFQDCTDKYYEEASMKEQTGCAMLRTAEFNRALVESPFRAEIDEEYGPQYLKALLGDSRVKAAGQELMGKEQQLIGKYQQMKAKKKFTYQGKELSEGEMLKFFDDSDREVRKEARRVVFEGYLEDKEEFKTIAKELVQTRDAIAKANGFENYIAYADIAHGRYDYGKKELDAFREQVKKELVPLVSRLHEEQKKELGIDTFMFYDSGIYFKDGNPVPVGDAEVLTKAAMRMYGELSPSCKVFFEKMVELGNLDVTASPNKISGMGFCTTLGRDCYPFIFGNCNGTSTDIAVFTHEIGHAYQAYLALGKQPLEEYIFGGVDIAEIPSKTMELFSYPYAEDFFGKDADKFRKAHFMGALEEIIAYCCIDEFEDYLYSHVDAPVEEWIQKEEEIAAAYAPDVQYGEMKKYFDAGIRLFRNMGVYMFPRYVVSYALSEMCALEFLQKMEADSTECMESYMKLCAAGGSLSYQELLEQAGLHLAYEDGSVSRTVEYAEKRLKLVEQS